VAKVKYHAEVDHAVRRKVVPVVVAGCLIPGHYLNYGMMKGVDNNDGLFHSICF